MSKSASTEQIRQLALGLAVASKIMSKDSYGDSAQQTASILKRAKDFEEYIRTVPED